jgi:hypothetical protein
MLFKSQNILSDIHYALSLITTDIKYGTFLNFNDKAKASEKIFAFVLSRLLGRSFEECDLKMQHYPAIDLSSGDFAIQVSAQDTPSKIKDSIEAFKKHIEKGTYENEFSRIAFFIISHKAGFQKNVFSDIDSNGLFNPEQDIFFSTQIGRQIAKLEDHIQLEIRDYLWNELRLESNSNTNRFRLITSLDKELKNSQNEIKPKTTQLEFDNDLLFYKPEELELIDMFIQRVSFESHIPFLITGYPSSGKTTTAFKVVQTLKETLGIIPFYIRVNQQSEYYKIFEDLEIIDGRPSILIIDDIHLNFELANRIITENQDFKNVIFIFVSRYVSNEYRLNHDNEDIFKDLEKNTLQLEKFNSTEFHKDKIVGIVDKYALYLETLGYSPRKGGVLHLESISKKNLLKLKLLLSIWCKDEDVISNINDEKLNADLYSKYLHSYSSQEIDKIITYASLYSFDIPFEKIEAREQLDSEKEGLFYTEELKSIFMQPSFCDLLIDAFIYKEQRIFKSQYNNDKDRFKFVNIKKYIEEYPSGVYQDYPEFIADIFINVGSIGNYQILNLLVEDKVTIQPLVSYFHNSDIATSSQLKRIIQLIKLLSSRNLEDIINRIIIEHNSPKELFLRDKSGLLVLSYIHYSVPESNKKLKQKLYSIFSDADLKEIIENTSSNIVPLAIQYLRDKNQRARILSLIPIDYWQNLINELPFELLGNTLTELRNISHQTASKVFSKLDEKKIASQIRHIHFYKFTKNLSELKTFEKKKDDSKAKYILNHVEIWRIKKSLEHPKTTIQHIASGFAQLVKIDTAFLATLLQDYSAKILYEKLKSIKVLGEYGLMLLNISKASPSFAGKILKLIITEHYFLPRFNSSGIKGKEIANILQDLYKLGDRDYGKKLLRDMNYDILEGRVISSTPDVSSFIIKSVKLFEPNISARLLKKFLEQDIITKIDNRNFELSQISSLLTNLRFCDKEICEDFYSDIENKIFIQKSLKGKVSFREIATFLSLTYECNTLKTEDLYTNIYAHDVVHKKIREETLGQFVSSLNSLHKIRPDYTFKLINSFINQKGMTKDKVFGQMKLTSLK